MALPRLQDLDVCVIDLDDCLVRGISKVAVARHVALSVAVRPLHPRDRRHLPRLTAAALVLLAARAWQKAGGGLSSGDLVQLYARWLGPLPAAYFKQAAQTIPMRLQPGAEAAFGWLAERWPVGVVSLGLSEVLRAVDDHLRHTTGHGFAFRCGNDLAALLRGDGPQPVLSAEDKRAHLHEQLARLGCRRPLVIGHDREDLGLARLARELGGVAVGLGPARNLAHEFDLVLGRGEWQRLPGLLERRLGD